jgi:hypothetical protein
MEKLDNISRSSYIMLYITLITTSLDPVIYNIYIYISITSLSLNPLETGKIKTSRAEVTPQSRRGEIFNGFYGSNVIQWSIS